MTSYMNEVDIRKNLADSGLNKIEIEDLMNLYKENNKEKIHKFMNKHREKLLTNVHKKEKEIDCLDYFLYQLDKK